MFVGVLLIAKNESKKNNTSAPREPWQWQTSELLFQNYSADVLILQIYCVFTGLAIIISNSILLHKLFNKSAKTRADKVFMILSCSDIIVGLFSVPTIALPLFIRDFDTLGFMMFLIWNFSAYFPYCFSWALIIIIALDRVLIITKGHIYKKYVPMRVLYRVIIFCLAFILIIVITIIMEKTMRFNSRIMVHVQLALEICFIIITVVAYIYLFYFVQSTSGKIANKRHGGININKNLMMTVTYTYVCLLFFTFPHFIFTALLHNDAIEYSRIRVNLLYWGIVLPYSNSYANAFIILYYSCENRRASSETTAL